MLGATHACANPLSARYGTTHAVAIGVMLPHVVRWNSEPVDTRYAELLSATGRSPEPGRAAEALAQRLEELARMGGLPQTLSEIGVRPDDVGWLAENAATQWTGTFNPRPFVAASATELYEKAF
jgi:alcohol dehydrogenase